MSSHVSDVVVVGGGVIGTSIAYHLACRGVRVTVVEQRTIASGASGASAGGVRQQGRDLRELPLAIKSIERWATLEDELEADVQYRREGHLRVVEDEADLAGLEPWMDAQRKLGLDIRLVAGDDLRELIPGISPHVVAATYSPSDGHANPILTTHAFAMAAKRRGARIQVNTRVTGIHNKDGRVTGVSTTAGPISCDWLVLAAGAWTPELARQIGVELPIVPAAPQMIATTPRPMNLRQVVGAKNRRLSLKQIPSGNYVIGGGWPGDVDLERGIAIPRLDSILGSLSDASAIYPDVANAEVERIWVGIEGLAADEVPILGAIPGFDNLTVAAGFSGHGFALGPIIGQVISELVLDGEPSVPIDELSIERFVGTGVPACWPTLRAG